MKPCRLVIADDAPDVRSLLRTLLEANGFDVVGEARNGDEAVETTRTEQPDVVLLDLSMPVKDGLEAMPEIAEASPDTRVVILSGFVTQEVRTKVESMGASACVEKGARIDNLLEVLNRVCRDTDAGDPS